MANNNDEDLYLMVSGIQHFQFCKRQWALIHIEQQWAENVKTVEGHYVHRNTDKPFIKETRGSKIIVRAMPIKSNQLKISGICDVVEFVRDDSGVEIFGYSGKYIVHPVEYKRGKPKKGEEDIFQLAAQALCLEEMLLCEVSTGYLYYHEIKHRVEVQLTAPIKIKVKEIIAEMHDYYLRKHTPKVKTGPFCLSCSLQNICMPTLMNKRSAKSYIEGKINE